MKKIILVIMFVLCCSGVLYAETIVSFEWEPNTESDLAFYRLYESDISGAYAIGEGNAVAEIPAGRETVNTSVPDGVWHWVLTAVDTRGNESGISQEVTYSADTTPPPAVGGFRITSTQENP